MRNLLLILVCLSLLSASAQTQQGYVKTRGRLVNGSVVAGQRLSGVTVQVKGRNAVVSKANGTFSFPVPANRFSIQSVKKQGYALIDPEAIAKQYSYSANPLILVMETPSQQTGDKLETERKLRRTLTRQREQQEEEIERLKEQNKLTEAQYHQALQKLYAEQDKSMNLVSQMAERYSRIDFDQLNEFNRRVSECIIEGRLTEADSLIKSKGDLKERIATHNKHHEANVEARKHLEDSEAMEIKNRDDLAQDCYNQFLIHKLQHHPDSAAYYIEQRALLDTTNIDWLCDAANYFKESGRYERALDFFLIAHNQCDVGKDGDILYNIGLININLGKATRGIQAYEQAIEAYKVTELDSIIRLSKLLQCYENLYVESISNYDMTKIKLYNTLNIESSNQMDVLLDSLSSNEMIDLAEYSKISICNITDKTINFYNRVLLAVEAKYGRQSIETAKEYIKLGGAYRFDEMPKAIECYEKAHDIINEIDSMNPLMAEIFGELAQLYRFKPNRTEQDVLKSIDYDLNAIIVYSHNYGFNHPHLYNIYHRLAGLYYKIDNDSLALQYYLKEIELKNRLYNDGFDIADAQIGIANIYERQNNDTIALKYYLGALDSQKKCAINTSEIKNLKKIYVYDKYLGEFYLRHHNYEAALTSFMNSMTNLEEYGGSPPATLYGDIGLCYVALSDSCSGINYILMALKRFTSSLQIVKSNFTDDLNGQIENSFDLMQNGQCSEALYSVLMILQNLNVDDGQIGPYGEINYIQKEIQESIAKLKEGLLQVLNDSN